MKKFISTLLCIVFVAALMPAQIAKADSDVMSVANQVKVPILNEQTYNNKKLIDVYKRQLIGSPLGTDTEVLKSIEFLADEET